MEGEERWFEILRGYEGKPENLIPMLQRAQRALGYLPEWGRSAVHSTALAASGRRCFGSCPSRLLAPPPPVEDAHLRQVTAIAQRVGELEDTVAQATLASEAAADYSKRLEAAIAAKNAHIEQIEAALREREGELATYQPSFLYYA